MIPGLFTPQGLMKAAESFPIIEATNTYTSPSSATSHNVPLPAGIQAGDLVMLSYCIGGTGNPNLSSVPSGWTQLGHTASGPGASDQVRLMILYTVASGSLSSVSLSFSATTHMAAISHRISKFKDAPVRTRHFGLDGPTLTPPWGSKKTLWMPIIGYYSTSSAAWTPPPNYTGLIHRHNSSGSRGIVSSSRFLKAGSENSGAYSGPSASNVDGYLVATQGK